ncbi:MAG: diphosphate--fructose-6-phosphate 1-phosphotransferase [Actinobacteria bacterium]|nr:diphosphate--fructose-6-phosphate 1-phosphotransferase [Actinomycetota bacterium]
MSVPKGNCIVAQSGGPTAVINASVAGVVEEASKHSAITGIYGALNGIRGVLLEEIFDLGTEPSGNISGLHRTPAAALGSCRYKLKDLETSRADYERILEVFKAHNIRYFFYAGGNDSMDTADKTAKLAAETGYELVAIGIPKTIDNDLACTDHCPGYGSVAKYVATVAMEAGKDTEALYTTDTCTVLEVMGRNAGWIAAATGLARRCEQDAPHLIYLPEAVFSIEKFVADVKAVQAKLGRVFIVVGEGLKDKNGNYVTTQVGDFAKDSFGHVQLGGVAEMLKNVVELQAGFKCRYVKLGTCQRNAMHFASATDVAEAGLCGRTAVKAAMAGEVGKMVTLVREQNNKKYKCSTGLAALSDVANGEKKVPAEFINKDGNFITDAFREYAEPLIRGEADVQIGDDGLPVYVRLEKHMLEKKAAGYRL